MICVFINTYPIDFVVIKCWSLFSVIWIFYREIIKLRSFRFRADFYVQILNYDNYYLSAYFLTIDLDDVA